MDFFFLFFLGIKTVLIPKKKNHSFHQTSPHTLLGSSEYEVGAIYDN